MREIIIGMNGELNGGISVPDTDMSYFDKWQELIKRMVRYGVKRNDIIVAVSDWELVSFAARTYMRGVRCECVGGESKSKEWIG